MRYYIKAGGTGVRGIVRVGTPVCTRSALCTSEGPIRYFTSQAAAERFIARRIACLLARSGGGYRHNYEIVETP